MIDPSALTELIAKLDALIDTQLKLTQSIDTMSQAIIALVSNYAVEDDNNDDSDEEETQESNATTDLDGNRY